MPKLLQINSALNKGSTGRIAEQIGALARNRGWETYMIHGARYVNKSDMFTFQVVSPFEEKLHAVKSLLFDAHGLGSERGTRKVIEFIKKLQPDIIHLHNLHGYHINYRVLFEYLLTVYIPIVWTLHDCWTMTGHCSHFDAIGCDRWKTECFNCPLRGGYPKSLFIDNSKRNYKLKKNLFTSIPNMTIVPVSQWLGDIVKQSYLKDNPIRVISNGIDVELFSPKKNDLRARLGLNGKTVILGVASAWPKSKGIKEFISLSAIPHYKVVMVGVSEKLKKELPSSILAIERTNSQHELASYYSMADVFVNPTYCDTFPTVNLEALACGTPIVTYRTGGSPEIVTNETGIVVEKGNFVQLISAIEEVRENGKEFYSVACRKHAVELYNKDRCYQGYINLYVELLRSRKVILP